MNTLSLTRNAIIGLTLLTTAALFTVLWANRRWFLERLGLRTVDAESVAWDTYFAADKASGQIMWRDLPRAAGNSARWAKLWDDLAFLARLSAAVHLCAFGPKPNEDEGGRDLSDSWLLAADLVRMVANTELLIAGQMDSQEELDYRTWLLSELFDEEHSGVRFADLAHRLASEQDRVERYRLIRLMWHEVYPVVGGQAAETLSSFGRMYLMAAGWKHSAIYAETQDQFWTEDDPAEVASRDLVAAELLPLTATDRRVTR